MPQPVRSRQSRELWSNGDVSVDGDTASRAEVGAGRFLLDREIRSVERDAFGHRDFALLLRSLIESSQHPPPFSIGLLGPWGTGKSSIKALYLSDLVDDQINSDGRRRNERIHSITFNAWRYGGENIKRALLRHAYLALGGRDSTLRDALFHQIQHTFQHPKSLSDLRREIAERYGWTTLQVFLLAFIAVGMSKVMG